jgi:sugar lactone lactonase YvrE
MIRSHSTLALAALTLAAGCGRRAGGAAAGDDTTAAPAAAAAPDSSAPAASGPTRLEGFQNPESAKYDAELDVWYVSNVNGSPGARDGNGYISRLKGDGTMDSLKFIAGGVKGVMLDAPKGLALQGDTLWVADITKVRAFNRRTGAVVANIPVKGSRFLNDVAVGEDGIYLTDTGIEIGAKGMNHVGPDRIYRIGPKHAVTVAIQNDSLAGPNGIAWDAAAHQFIVVPLMGKTVVAWVPGAKTVKPLGATKGELDGLELLDGGRLLITSWADSSLDVFDNGTVTPVSKDLPSPADIGVDTKRNRVAIPLLMENRVEFRPLPAGRRSAS